MEPMIRSPGVPFPEADPASGDPVALAQALVRTPSVNPSLEEGGSGEGEAVLLCARWLEGWGYAVQGFEAVPGRPSLIAERTWGTGPALILNGHLDTVGVQGMTVDPFAGRIEEGRLLGRGSCDMKGGIGSLLAAAHALSLDPPAGGTLRIALVADEEHASLGTQELLTNGLTGDLAIVCEPTGLALMPAHKGFAWIEVEVIGRAAHGSRPDRGVDAIRGAGLILGALDRIERGISEGPLHPLLGRGSIHAGTISGGMAPSIYPDRCTFVLERRTLAGEDLAQALAEVRALIAGLPELDPRLEIRVSPGLFRPGSEVDPEHPGVRAIRRAMEEEGMSPRLEPMTAWVDAAFFNAAGIPAFCFGPGSIEWAHAADELCPVTEILSAARVLERGARNFLSGSASG